MPADAKVCALGVLVPSEVTWTDWKAGGEYQKNIVIKNPTYEPRRIKARMPPSGVFKLTGTRKIFVAPGNSFLFPISFFPQEEVEYSECLELKNELGCFCLTLHGKLPGTKEVELRIPRSVDMGICAVGHTTTTTFEIVNVSSVATDIFIDCPLPVSIATPRFHLPGCQSTSVCATFLPLLAKSYTVNAVVSHGNNMEKRSCIGFTGKSKYPLILAFVCLKYCCRPVCYATNTCCSCICGPDGDDCPLTNKSNNAIASHDEKSTAENGRDRSKARIRSKSGRANRVKKDIVACNSNRNVNNEVSGITNSNNNAGEGAVDDEAGCKRMILNFGEVTPGERSKKHIIIRNMSMVDSYYFLSIPQYACKSCMCGDDDNCGLEKIFHFEKGEGLLESGCFQMATITFGPKESGQSYKAEVMLQSSSGLGRFPGITTTNQIFPRTSIICIGRGSAPRVFLCREILCFPPVEVPVSFSKCFEVINRSLCPTYFQFQIDNQQSAFKIEPHDGEVAASGRIKVRVTFSPKVPMNYYRKVACLVHHKGAVYLHLLGTCTSGESIPVALTACHLYMYECFRRRRISHLELQRIAATCAMESCPPGPLTNTEDQLRLSSSNEDFMDDGCTSVVTKSMPHISTDINAIHFGNHQFGQDPSKRELCLTNHTRGPISIQWIYCSDVFSVMPMQKVLGGEQSAMFKVTFRPAEQSQFYFSEVECYATPEPFVSYKTTDERILFVPWCITLSLSGNSFGPCCERILPVLNIDRPVMTLRSLGRKRSSFGTMRISNEGSDPIFYDLQRDPFRMFLHKPSSGLIEPGANQIVLFMFNPALLEFPSLKIDRCLNLALNDQSVNDRPIKIEASISMPLVSFGSNGRLAMRPTCTGLRCRAVETVTNACCTPLHFKWIVPVAYEKMLMVEPTEGFLNSCETQAHEWSFISPLYEDKLIKVNLQVRLVPPGDKDNDGGGDGDCGNGCPDDESCLFSLVVITRGTRAELTSKDDTVKLGPLLVSHRHLQYVTEIGNDFPCDIFYRLHVTEEVATPIACRPGRSEDDDGDTEEEEEEEKTQFEFSAEPPLIKIFPWEGTLSARTKQVIHCIIQGLERRHYRWTVSYTLHGQEGKVLDFQPELRLFQVLACGIIPELRLIDICTRGSAQCLSRPYMWRMFSIDRLNSKIKCDLSNSMKRFSQSRLRGVDFYFPAGPTGIKPCTIVLMFKNCGLIPCEWRIFLPSDKKVQVDKWAESGELTPEDYHEMEIVDNQLFAIFPNKGCLDLDQTCQVTLTYNHTLCGNYILPVALKIKGGNEVKINLFGTTVDPNIPHLHLPLREFRLDPVFIGSIQGPVQAFEVLNSGSVDVKFQVDTTNLDELVKANYDYKVMECLTTSGCIKAGQTGTISVRLNPIEAKMYSVDLMIEVQGGSCYPISFMGEGKDYRCRISKSDQTCSSVSNSSIPDQQTCLGLEQICRLSVSQLNFGNVPVFCTLNRLVTLTNCSPQHAACYRWTLKNPDHSQVIKVEPSSGCLNPGESVMAKVILRSGDEPRITEADLICETTNLTEATRYEQDLSSFMALRHKSMVEVDFSEVGHCQDINTVRNMECEGHPYARESEGVTFPKYKTLPPIVKTGPPVISERAARKTQKYFIEKPKSPVPSILFLSIRARTYELQEFKILFPGCYQKFFVDRCIGTLSEEKPGDTCGDSGRRLRLTGLQYEVLEGIFSGLLRDLLDDESFVSSCVELACEPLPYFQQFKKEKKEEGPRDPCWPITNVRRLEAGEEIIEKTSEEYQGGPSEATLVKRQKMKNSPKFGILCEGMMEETLFNIIQEAFHGEFNITARPRLAALARDRRPMTNCEASED